MINKAEFRNQQIRHLAQNKDIIKKESIPLINRLSTLPEWQNAKTVATIISGDIEITSTYLIDEATRQGKTAYIPLTRPKRQMVFLPYTNDDKDSLIKSHFGVLEPPFNADLVNNDVDLMIIPGVAYDTQSHKRVGFGGGYYDRFLANYTGKTVALVASPMAFSPAEWPLEDHDMPIQTLITMDHIFRLD